jgi:hypothetical protein
MNCARQGVPSGALARGASFPRRTDHPAYFFAMPPRIARLAGLGAFGAIGGFVALFALLAFVSRPTPLGGMTMALSSLTWISLGVVFLGLIAVHVVLGKQLLALSKGEAAQEL